MLIRRVGSGGRRAVGGKLDWVKRNMKGAQDPWLWERYIVSVVYPIYGERYPEQLRRKVPETYQEQEAALRALGSTPLDGTLPWYFREWVQLANRIGENRHGRNWERIRGTAGWGSDQVQKGNAFAQAAGTLRDYAELRDWYLGARPNLMRLDFNSAVNESGRWHIEQVEKQSGKRLSSSEAREFVRMLEWSDGHWLGQLPPLRFGAMKADDYETRWNAQRRALMHVGMSLGHCYRTASVADSYLNAGRIWVLFDRKNKPRWTAVVRGAGGHLVEAKGPANMPILPEHLRYFEEAMMGPATAVIAGKQDYLEAVDIRDFAQPGSVKRDGKILYLTGQDGRRYFLERSEGGHPALWTGGLFDPNYKRKPDDPDSFLQHAPFFYAWEDRGYVMEAGIGDILKVAREF